MYGAHLKLLFIDLTHWRETLFVRQYGSVWILDMVSHFYLVYLSVY